MICTFIKIYDLIQRIRIKPLENRPKHQRKLVDYSQIESLSVDIKFMLMGCVDFKFTLAAT